MQRKVLRLRSSAAMAFYWTLSAPIPAVWAAQPQHAMDPARRFHATDQIIVRLRDGSTPDMTALSRAAGEAVELRRTFHHGAWVGRIGTHRDEAEVEALAARIAALPEVAYAEPDRILYPTALPTDPLMSQQWDLQPEFFGVNIGPAMNVTRGQPDVVVAVIDTGLTNHADLAGQVLPGYDFISDTRVANDGSARDADASDPGDWITSAESLSGYFLGCRAGNSSWHGTHVAGTIAAKADNGIGISGIAPETRILPVRVLGKCGGYTSDIVDGMRWAAGLRVTGIPANPNPASILSLSLGGSGPCGITQQQAIDDITAVGSTVVVAAGNANGDASGFNPANCNRVLTVAATGSTGNRAYYSNYGTTVELAAPGGDARLNPGGIWSTLNTGTQGPATDTYAAYQGTSMATPHVSAVAALVKAVNPSLTPGALIQHLQGNARRFPLGSTCTTSLCGAGIVDAGLAVAAAGTPRQLGGFAKTSPAPGSAGIGTAAPIALQWTPSSGATAYDYCVVAGLNTPCTNWIPAGNANTAMVSGLTAATLYTWQVRATDGLEVAEANVGIRSTFTTATLPGAFNKSAPANGATGRSTTSTLAWTASSGATSYEYCLDTLNNNLCDGTWTGTGSARSVIRSGLAARTTYYWQVRASNAGGKTSANLGTWWRFTTQ